MAFKKSVNFVIQLLVALNIIFYNTNTFIICAPLK